MRNESYHNTPDQVEEYARAALELLELLEPDEDLRVPLLVWALGAYGAKSIIESPPPGFASGVALPGLR